MTDHITNAAQTVRKGSMAAQWTYDPEAHAYYFAPMQAAAPPYPTQRHVDAILDIAADGTLAGVELIDNMPPPPASLYAAQPPAAPVETGEWEEVTDGTTLPGDRFSYIPNPETGVGQITSHKRRVQPSSAGTAQVAAEEKELFAAVTKHDLAGAISHLRNFFSVPQLHHRQQYADLLEAQAKLIAHLVNRTEPQVSAGTAEPVAWRYRNRNSKHWII